MIAVIINDILFTLLGLYAAFVLQLIIHELGHLFYGTLTGYQFQSLRIFSFILVKQERGIRLKRMPAYDSAGACIMTPPPLESGRYSALSYNLGGVLFNGIASVFCLLGFFFLPYIAYASAFLLILGIVGLIFAIMTGFARYAAATDNDGVVISALSGNKEAMKAFWNGLMISFELARGKKLRQMPKEWFELPDDEFLSNRLLAAQGVRTVSRLVDEKAFEEAASLADFMLETDKAVNMRLRLRLTCDRIYCELMTQKDRALIGRLIDPLQQRFMRNMHKDPQVMRTNQAYALLIRGEDYRGEKLLAEFDRMALKHPYRGMMEGERELMVLALEKYKKEGAK